jgi:hypothetical protein
MYPDAFRSAPWSMITMGSVSGLLEGLYIQTVMGAGSCSNEEENEKDCFPFCNAGDCDAAVIAKKNNPLQSTKERIKSPWPFAGRSHSIFI